MENELTNLIVLLNTEQAAKYLGVSSYSVKLSRCSGQLCGVPAPAYKKIGRLVRYEPSVIGEWLDQFEPQANTGCGK
jgi:hypothetical protein